MVAITIVAVSSVNGPHYGWLAEAGDQAEIQHAHQRFRPLWDKLSKSVLGLINQRPPLISNITCTAGLVPRPVGLTGHWSTASASAVLMQLSLPPEYECYLGGGPGTGTCKDACTGEGQTCVGMCIFSPVAGSGICIDLGCADPGSGLSGRCSAALECRGNGAFCNSDVDCTNYCGTDLVCGGTSGCRAFYQYC